MSNPVFAEPLVAVREQDGKRIYADVRVSFGEQGRTAVICIARRTVAGSLSLADGWELLSAKISAAVGRLPDCITYLEFENPSIFHRKGRYFRLEYDGRALHSKSIPHDTAREMIALGEEVA